MRTLSRIARTSVEEYDFRHCFHLCVLLTCGKTDFIKYALDRLNDIYEFRMFMNSESASSSFLVVVVRNNTFKQPFFRNPH